MEASKFWSLKSWDRTQVPQPFSTVALVVGEPIYVAADADAPVLESKRIELEKALFELERRASQLLRAPGAPSNP